MQLGQLLVAGQDLAAQVFGDFIVVAQRALQLPGQVPVLRGEHRHLALRRALLGLGGQAPASD